MKRHIILLLILISLFVINGRSYAQAPVGDLASFVTNCLPAPYSEQVPLNNMISFDITDDGKSVDANSVEVKVNGKTVYKDGKSPDGNCQMLGTKRDYTFIYQTQEVFNYEQRVTITITAFDYAGNELKQYEYHIMTQMRSFGRNRNVNSDLGNLDSSRPVTVCDSDGNVWVAWQAGSIGNRDIYISKLPAGAENFDIAVKVTNNVNDHCNPAIALDSNKKLYVVWQDNRQADDNNQGDWDIYLSTSTDGKTWSTETRVNDLNKNNQVNPAIAIDSNDNLYVVWQDDSSGNQDIYIAKSSDGFTTKTVSQPITTDTLDQIEPAITIDSANTVYVVWTDGRNSSSDIYGAASNKTWANEPVINDPSNQTSPVIAAESTGTILHLLWEDDTDPNGSIFYASTIDGLLGPLTIDLNVVDVDERKYLQKEPAIAVTGSTGTDLKVYACWQDWRNVDTTNPNDTDLYFAELSSDFRTNIFVGDESTNSYQGEPAIGVCKLGFPYLVWTDGRKTHTDIYYAGSTFVEPVPLWSEIVSYKNDKNAIYGVPEGHLRNPGDISIKVPPRAFPCDVWVNASRIMNTQRFRNKESIGQYEFGPSGINFSVPIKITIAVEPLSAPVEVYWYDPVTDTFRQDGITNVTYKLEAQVPRVSFKTRHFTPFYLFEGDAAAVVGGGGGGGGCAISASSRGNVIEYVLPYVFYVFVLFMIKLKDTRNRKII